MAKVAEVGVEGGNLFDGLREQVGEGLVWPGERPVEHGGAELRDIPGGSVLAAGFHAWWNAGAVQDDDRLRGRADEVFVGVGCRGRPGGKGDLHAATSHAAEVRSG